MSHGLQKLFAIVFDGFLGIIFRSSIFTLLFDTVRIRRACQLGVQSLWAPHGVVVYEFGEARRVYELAKV